MKKVTIIDYGVGNLFGLKRALEFCGAEVVISEDAETIERAERIVLPGVGAFEAGMRGLATRGLIEPVQRVAARGTPMLGICLGAQILLGKGHEFGEHDGLGIIPGSVVQLEGVKTNEKIPHVGWNSVVAPESVAWEKTIFDALPHGFNVYFTHSYVFVPAQKEHVFGLTTYGGETFVSSMRKGNVYGVQFHPERSSETGLHIIKNFVTIA